MNKKILYSILCIILTFNLFTFCSYAEDVTEYVPELETEPGVETTSTGYNAAYEAFYAQIEQFANSGYDVYVNYTSDSVCDYGIVVDPDVDILAYTVSLKINTSYLPSGVEIYDDPATDIIDGIRIDGAEITSYTVPIDLSVPRDITVAVKLVYSDGVLGTLAMISDGNYDWSVLLQDPLILMQGAYYFIAALSLIISAIAAFKAKKKKVKTAEEIAAQVDAKVKEGCDNMSLLTAELLQQMFLPIFTEAVNSNKSVVKALTLSTSKNKEAPVALLDLLKEVSDVDTTKIIEEARESVLKNIADVDAKRELTRNILSQIATGTYQEVSDETDSTPKGSENSEPKTERKSVL